MWGDNANSIEVSTVTVDELVKTLGLDQVNLLKIDVEGAECLALKGAENTLKTFHPLVCFEKGEGDQEAVNLLESLGYSFFEMKSCGNLTTVTDTHGFFECLVARIP